MAAQGSMFRPPEGLLPHEEVLLVSRKGSLGLSLPFIAWGGGGLLLAIGLSLKGGCTINGVPQPASVCEQYDPVFAAVGVLAIIGGFWVAFQGIRQRDTKYFVTTFRLVETRREKIRREIPRTLFRGREFSQYLEKRVVPVSNRSGSMPDMCTVRLLNPESADVLMTLKNLPLESVSALEAIGGSIYCPYCGCKNDSKNTVCTQCGANL